MRLDDNGWCASLRQIPSPNYRPRSAREAVQLAVVHAISLPAGEFGGDDVERLFTNTLDCGCHPSYESLRGVCVSAHFFIRRNGELIQFVSCRDAAWHAGESRWRGRQNCNDFSIGVELEGTDDVLYDDCQYDVLAALLTALARCYPGIKVAGHEHIAPGRKTDPGRTFDWARLFAIIGGEYDGRITA